MHSPNGTPPCRRRQLQKPWLDTWLVAACAHFVDSLYPFRRSFGCVLYRTRFIWSTMYRSTIGYHSDLSDQSALEIRVRISVRLKDALF